MSDGFLKLAAVVEIVALALLYMVAFALVWYGMWVAGLAFAAIGTMIVKPWGMRWPRRQID